MVLAIAGCATSGNPAVQDPAIISQVKVGQSSKADVARLLGEPNYRSTTQLNNRQHEVWAYGYAKHETNPLIYVPIINLFALAFSGLGETQSAGFSVYFDQDGIVRSISTSRSDIAIGGLMAPTKIESRSNTRAGSPDEQFRIDQNTNVNTSP